MNLLRASSRLGKGLALFSLWWGAISSSAAAGTGSRNEEATRVVFNLGHAGDNTADLLTRLESDVLSKSPELVILLVGTNDLLNSRHALPLDSYHENLRTLVRRITARKIVLFLVTLPPAHGPYLFKRHPAEFYGAGGPNARIAAGNEVIRSVARESKLPIVDFFEACQRGGGASDQRTSLMRNLANCGSEDGVHPTPAGYQLLAELVADAIGREKRQDITRIACFGDSITSGVHVVGEGAAAGETYPGFLARILAEKYPFPSSPKP